MRDGPYQSDAGIKGWTKKECARWARQLGPLYDFDDLMQEASLQYLRTRETVCDPVQQPARFMAAYRKFVFNRFWLLKRYIHRPGEGVHAGDRLDKIPARIKATCLVEYDHDMPQVVGTVLGRLGILQEYQGRHYLTSRRRGKETPADFVRRLAGGQGDVLGQVLDYMEVRYASVGS